MKKILIAEDEPELREALAEILTAEGYEVVSVPDGEQCLAALQSDTFNLLLLDMRMPGVSGVDVITALSKENPAMLTSTLVLTNQSDMETLSEVITQGVFQYLIKADHSLAEIAGKVNEMTGGPA